jgi:hypothetical protein
MLPISLTVQLATADADGISLSQTPGAAGDLTITGALASGGVATLTSGPCARQVLITTVSNESAKTLTIYGTDANGQAIFEQVAGPNATTGTTVQYFKTVTRVAVSAAFTGAVTVGTNGVGGSRPIALDQWASGSVALQVDVDGTATFTVQQTLDDILTIDPENVDWISHPNVAFVGGTVSAQGNYAYAPAYVRLTVSSGTDPVTLAVRQSLY